MWLSGSILCISAVTSVIYGGAVKRYTPHFGNAERVTTVTSHSINEASGICASRIHKDVLFTHNDSGDTHRIFAFSATTGQRLATITIDGTHAQDWEDIACAPCAGGNGHCIYISDTGGNAGGDANTIYRMHEPNHLYDRHYPVDSILQFSWDQHNCETVMVDPNGEVYVVSKVSPGQHGKVVHLPASAWGTHHRIQVNEGVHLSLTASSPGPVGGDISPHGDEVLLKTYGHVYYWYVPDRDYYKHLSQPPITMPYHGEKQGEAVCWDTNASGYYTMSEGSYPPLYFYRRTSASLNPGDLIGK